MSAASMRSLVYQARLKQGMDLAAQAQAAARAAAQSVNPAVPNGLVIGGLKAVSNPVAASADSNGLHTWQGAEQPVQQTSSGGAVQVTVKQTEERAILSWETFNVGANTTLTFDQKAGSVPRSDWVVLNRVVGQLDPTTGLRVSGAAPAPSQILGSIKADGTVLVLNQNGILFGPTSQINTHSLVATSLEIGRALDSDRQRLSIAQRNSEFLTYGLLGYADQAAPNDKPSAFTFSGQATSEGDLDPLLEGDIEVAAGAQITSADGGYILLTGPKVRNAGQLTSRQGEAALQSGRQVTLQRSEGTANSVDPNVRGFVVSATTLSDSTGDYVLNQGGGLIDAAQGYVSLGATQNGAVIQQGVVHSTTSVARNGYVHITGGDIKLAPGGTIAIEADTGKETIPQDPTSLGSFKASRIQIGDAASRIEIGADSMIYAPSAQVQIGAAPGATTELQAVPDSSRIFIDDGAIITVAGLQNVLIPASRNEILIRPVKKNELRDTPDFRDGFLNGATVYVDPRISGVRADGVAWVGSPLIEAESYYQQVGVTASELMTRGGDISLGVASLSGAAGSTKAPSVVIKSGATLDLSGGWVSYEAGTVRTTRLVNSAGQVVDIADANPNDTYVGIYNGFTDTQARWGISRTYVNPILSGQHTVGAYTEGRDAGALTIKSPVVVLDGTVEAQSFPGAKQLLDAKTGSKATTVYGDLRHLQGAPSQLPSGGMLFIQALGKNSDGGFTGGGDIRIVDESQAEATPSGLTYGQSVSVDSQGDLVVPVADTPLQLPTVRYENILLSDNALSAMGLSQLSLRTSGQLSESATSDVRLNPGGVFDGLASSRIEIAGNITAASGTIQLETVDVQLGSVFNPLPRIVGAFDIDVSGTLSTRGLWVNDYGRADSLQGSAFTSGGKISLISAARVTKSPQKVNLPFDGEPLNGHETVAKDISGSILLERGSVLDVSGGGYVKANGALDLTARGGDVSLIDQTNYFQLADLPTQEGGVPGFRVTTILDSNGQPVIPVNPSRITSRVSLEGTILAAGFNGGGTFTLDTPQFRFGEGRARVGTTLPLDFFSRTGFANYAVTSYKTDLIANDFSNGLGGYNAVLATQVLSVRKGDTLSLTQTTFSQVLDPAHTTALQEMATGGDLYSVLTPSIANDAWDRRAVNLTLGGLMELHVEKGGKVVNEAGGVLTVAQLFNEGSIVMPGGTIRQSEILPAIYTGANAIAVHDLSEVFTYTPEGTIQERKRSAIDRRASNGEVAATRPIYLLGDLEAGEGVRLAKGSVTDLSGVAVFNPRAPAVGGSAEPGQNGRVVDGGSLISLPSAQVGATLFRTPFGNSVFSQLEINAVRASEDLNAQKGARIDLSGASATFTRLGTDGSYAPTLVWSDGGALSLGAGGTLTGALIDAHGGAPEALGGTLIALDPVLYRGDPDEPTRNAYSNKMIQGAGFSTFEAMGSIAASGDVSLSLDRGFFLVSRPVSDPSVLGSDETRDSIAPEVRGGGNLTIDAPYIRFDSAMQNLSAPPFTKKEQPFRAVFRADAIDIAGAVRFSPLIGTVRLSSTGDVRLLGAQPYQYTYGVGDQTVPSSLQGQLAVAGDLIITAAQVYPTTGTSFDITSSGADSTITFERAGATPDTPYSAGGDLLVQAANIVQGGVLRVPLGKLTLGSNTADGPVDGGKRSVFAPATQSVRLLDGSVTSVSADGLVIPYGVTTDQIEWFFSPTGAQELKAPPAAELHLGGADVAMDQGATVDIKGGGDLYAYEFISGTGGSRDVLSRFNDDPFSGNNGYQYPDQRQVYAVVPGLSKKEVAAYDPIYSSDYSALYGVSDAGKQVYLAASPGLPAGWYTLLPAKYALLPGGVRVVEKTGATSVIPGSSGVLGDGSYEVAGYYGVAGTDSRDSTVRVFDIQDQATFRKSSNIAQTFANQHFGDIATRNGLIAPRLPVDAGRLVLEPLHGLTIEAGFQTGPGSGGRGAQADISGAAFQIVSFPPRAPADGVITLTADSLTRLNASSLLLGGVRTDNADGTTSLDIGAHSIDVANDAAHPLTGPEVILAVDGDGSSISVEDGSAILASGAADPRNGDFVIDGSREGMTGSGALLRVASGVERLVERVKPDDVDAQGALDIGGATLSGTSVLVNASGDLRIARDAVLDASNLALGAGHVTFASRPGSIEGLVVTPELQAQFSKAAHLTIQSQNVIDVSAGTYRFGDLRLDTPGLALVGRDGPVEIDAGKLMLSNVGGGDGGGCGTDGGPACGAGSLALIAQEIAFGSGVVSSYGFGQGASLSASGGLFAQGKDGGFDAGSGSLAVEAPFIGDRAVALQAGQAAQLPSLSLTSTKAVRVSSPGGGSLSADVAGTPGSSVSINGQSVDIQGTRVRATAGVLDIVSDQGITIGGGAVLETPSYAKTFGDEADSFSVSAPGGLLHLTARTGDVDVATGSTLSVGGGTGRAGALQFTASKGAVRLNEATINATAPEGAASFFLDTAAAFDLNTFSTGMGLGFDGSIGIHTGSGDLALDYGHVLKAENVYLSADGGSVLLGGSIDVSGVQGGDVSLYGLSGVTLASTARIDARAAGYGEGETRQAHGGKVQIGVDGAGAISVAAGAVIDVSAARPQDRLVSLIRNGLTYYSYVPGDVGGEVSFRAPIIQKSGRDTVDVSYGGLIAGASSIVLEGFKHFDLEAIAKDDRFTGVKFQDGAMNLDLTMRQDGKLNWLADDGPGTLVSFVQDFDISAVDGQLGGLASSTVFHKRAGMELDYAGAVVLKSNWNLGAGAVDVQGALGAGDMKVTPTSAGACATDPAACKYYVVPGHESDVFARFTTLTYRTDADHDGNGDVTGEPGVLTIRASGDLDLKGSITDGFFQFRDQTDPDYLNQALGGGSQLYVPYLNPGCSSTCAEVPDYSAGELPDAYVRIGFPSGSSLGALPFNPAPYSPDANSPAALGSLENHAGDPLGSAELFPLIERDGRQLHVDSTSYRLIAGADLTGPGGAPSVDPMRVDPASSGNVTVEGRGEYSYQASRGTGSAFTETLLLAAGGDFVSPDAWLQAFLADNAGVTSASFTLLDFARMPAEVRPQMLEAARDYFAAHPSRSNLVLDKHGEPTGVSTSLDLAAGFLADVFDDPSNKALAEAFVAAYKPPKATAYRGLTTARTSTVVRSGSGSIQVAAAGNVDLRNGDPVYLSVIGDPASPSENGLQLGGAAVYTAGYRVGLSGVRTAIDPVSGALVTVDASPYFISRDNFAALTADGYRYGAGGDPTAPGAGFTGVLISNPVYAEGGGDISLVAGQDVLGRLGIYQSQRIYRYEQNNLPEYDFLGSADQLWRVGSIGRVSNARINPQLFSEGVGALGGGDIRVRAGRDVSDLSTVSDTSITTGDVAAPAGVTQALMTFGGGDVDVQAGRDLLGGRLDVARGSATLGAGRDVASAGDVNITLGIDPLFNANLLRVRLSDAEVRIEASDAVLAGGIGGLGVHSRPADSIDRLNALGFYSDGAGVSILANGSVEVANRPLLSDLTSANDIATPGDPLSARTITAIYPGTFQAAALTGDLTVATDPEGRSAPTAVFMIPSAKGELQMLAGADIAPMTIAMDDGDPGLLPGVFSSFDGSLDQGVTVGRTFVFPGVLPSTSDVDRAAMHSSTPTHMGDEQPNRVYAGGDINGMILSVPKQTRVGAGQDIINMMFFGQNLTEDDITRVAAGRDISATTRLVQPLLSLENGTTFGAPLVAVQGNDFVVGGPGSFFVEAGRDAGPFLNSATTNGYATDPLNVGGLVKTGSLSFGGGVLSVGNEWNPWLGDKGSNLYVEFGVGKGANFTSGYVDAAGNPQLSLRDTYVDPANLDNLDGDLFVQVKDASGNQTPDRSQPIYGPILIKWMQQHAATQLTAAYGGTDVNFQQAYDVFKTLPQLSQRVFLLDKIYFNELTQTSIPTGPSYLQYSRGYSAVNALFPSALGYTANDLTGGGNGANTLVQTGNLDLRLATIETARGGDIYILGPGGRVVAGSTVRTSQQAARRAYDAGALFVGNSYGHPVTAAITAIPLGFEGVLSLRGGSINSFTDADFLLNQSRVFSQAGGDIAMWSSNGDLNAGQGPKTSANFPPVVVKVDADLFSQVDSAGAVSGAGIAAFQPSLDIPAPSVFLIAPRGTVDAGDAGVRVAGNLFIAALQVANANNFSVGGTSFGIPSAPAVDVGAQTSGSAAAAAAQQAATAASQAAARGDDRSIITANVEGYVGSSDEDECRKDPRSPKCKPAQ